MRISVGKINKIHTCLQLPLRMKLPIQEKFEIDVCIDFRAYDHVLLVA